MQEQEGLYVRQPDTQRVHSITYARTQSWCIPSLYPSFLFNKKQANSFSFIFSMGTLHKICKYTKNRISNLPITNFELPNFLLAYFYKWEESRKPSHTLDEHVKVNTDHGKVQWWSRNLSHPWSYEGELRTCLQILVFNICNQMKLFLIQVVKTF